MGDSRPWAISFERLAVGLMFAALALAACLMPAQSDTFWALRAGQDIWRAGHVPRTDAYSYTAAGLPWPDHEWLWQALAFGLYRLGGMPLLTAGAAAIVMGAVTIVYRLMVGPPTTRFVLMLIALPLASVVWALRPQIVTLLGLAALLALLVREVYFVLPLLFLAWANAHGGVALGGLVLVAALLAAVWRARSGEASDRRRAVALAVVVPLCGLACAATPLGFGIVAFVFRSEARLRAAHISEWLPTLPNASVEGAFWLVAAAFLVVLARRRRALRGAPWGDVVAVAAAVALLPLAFRSVRNIGPFLLLSPVAASRLLGAGFRFRRHPAPATPDHPRLNAGILVGFVAACAVAVAGAWAASYGRLGWRPLPEGALAAVRACPEPLYNHYNEGGFLIWFVPEKRVFVDSRQDPYPLPFLLEHIRVESGKLPYRPLFDRFGIRCVFLSAESPTVARLGEDGWVTRFRDDKFAVLTTPAPPSARRVPP